MKNGGRREPLLAILHVGEAVARGQNLRLSVLDVRKRVAAGIDGRSAIHADKLVAKGNFEAGKNLKCCAEIVP
jgi:hypothetical protein